MACQSSATATEFSTSVGSSVSTSTSTSVTTIAGTTSTQLITSCLASSTPSSSANSTVTDVASCISSAVITSTTVVGGSVSTAQVPIEITNFFTSSVATKTLFAECSSTSSTSSHSSSTSTSFSQTTQTILSTPTSTFTSTSETTLDDGQVSVVVVTVTSNLPATSVLETSSVPVATTVQQTTSSSGSSSNTGTIVGASVGGIVGIIGILGIVWYIWHRRRQQAKWDDIFEKDDMFKPETPGRSNLLDLEDDEPTRTAMANTGPQPYVYGLVGGQGAPPSLNAGLTATPSSRPTLTGHDRSPSQQPLLLNNGFPSPRPSTGGSSAEGGLPPSPSFNNGQPSPGRSGSPGPNTLMAEARRTSLIDAPPDSPTSLHPPRGQLFVTNPRESFSPPVTPVLKVTNGIRASVDESIPSFGGAIAASGTVLPASSTPPSAFHNTSAAAEARGRDLSRNNTTVSAPSVYSQASMDEPLPPVPPIPQRPERSPARRQGTGVIVHTDAGRVFESTQPPSYKS